MTYPNAPLGRIFQHKTLATDTASGAGKTPMHPLIDVNLNAAATVLMAGTGISGTHAELFQAVTATFGAGAPILWDSLAADPGSIYNATDGSLLAVYDGIFLLNVNISVATASVGNFALLNGLDPAVYPAGQLRTRGNQSVRDGTLKIANFPWIARSGQKIYLTPNAAMQVGGSSHPGFTNSNAYSKISLAGLGGYPPALGSSAPYFPYASGSQWLTGEPVTDLKLQRRFAELMDDLQPYLINGPYGAGRAVFLASSQGQALTLNTAVPWSSIDFDNTSGWQATTPGYFTIPVDGLYSVGASLVNNTTGAAVQFVCDGRYSDFVPPGAGANDGASLGFVKRYRAGDKIAVTPYSSMTTWTSYASYLAVVQLGA